MLPGVLILFNLWPKGVRKRLEQFESVGDQKENGNGATDIVQIQSVIAGPLHTVDKNNHLMYRVIHK